MKPEVEQELAHVLLIELLAHQFTFPVRWIETQDVLLLDQGTERFIEIGPTPVLRNMAQKTLENLHGGLDPLIKQREFLSATTDSDRVYYRIVPTADEAPIVSPSQPILEVTAPPVLRPAPSTQKAVSAVADIPLTASHIIRAIVATKVKRPTNEIDVNTTIKKLAGGRSTLENEIVGDLLAEFKSLPDRAEEQTLATLSDLIEPSFAGKCNSYVISQLSRLFSTRMPGGYKVAQIKEYLNANWGLLKGRQDMVLLLALSTPPPTRLKTFEDAEAFFDDLVTIHANETGIIVQKGQQYSSAAGPTIAIDPSVVADLEKARNTSSKKHLQAYAQDLGIDLAAGEKKASAIQTVLDQALEELDLWNTEHGSAYGAGIKPIFQASKARTYKSWSHWALQDVTMLFHELMNEELEFTEQIVARRVLHILNCAEEQLVQHVQAFATKAKHASEDVYAMALPLLESLLAMCEPAVFTDPVFRRTFQDLMPVTELQANGDVSIREIPRKAFLNLKEMVFAFEKATSLSAFSRFLGIDHSDFAIRRHEPTGWKHNEPISVAYLQAIAQSKGQGISFREKTVLVIGAGPGSIAAEILKGLLAGGAKVICTTSNFSTIAADHFQTIYANYGGRNSSLTILPFNQASRQDVESLVSHIFGESGLGCDLDLILPFGAISEAGHDIDQIDARSELAHRTMLTNTVRLLGAIKRQKHARAITTRPAQVILPLSSNHGAIGTDGLYAESKLGLEGLLHKWHSEGWSNYLALCGTEIGWTRGTGLMSSNDVVAQEIEALGVRTFSCEEMAANVLALCAPSIAQFCQLEPLLVDLNGGLDHVKDLGTKLKAIRARLNTTKTTLRSLSNEQSHDRRLVVGNKDDMKDVKSALPNAVSFSKLSTLPDINYRTKIEPLVADLEGMVDLDRIAVITGFAELGSFGSARTRMEAEFGIVEHARTTAKVKKVGKTSFTDAGCVELAWMMGFIKRSPGKDANGWIDTETGDRILESTVKQKYEDRILANTGIRLIENNNQEQHSLQEIVLEADFPRFTATAQAAMDYVRAHGQYVETWQGANPDEWNILLKTGSTIMVPRTNSNSADVVGLLPTGWNPNRYGIDESIITQVDPTTLYTLIATVEALLVAGIPDFYELYEHIHSSEVANCIGSGIGGQSSCRSLFRGRYVDRPVQKDILQETFVNTTGAWINMLLLGASGPIRTPIGACATSLESLDSATELIHSGKAKVCIVGGVEDWTHEVGAEFANMRATADYATQTACGRPASEFSRPMSTTRGGFVEAQGVGIQIATSARLAIDLGLPIHAIVAFTGLASDGLGRSVPAPGKGLLNFAAAVAAEIPQQPHPPLNISYRRCLLEQRLLQIEQTRCTQIVKLDAESSFLPVLDQQQYISTRQSIISHEAAAASSSARRDMGNNFQSFCPSISPLAGALSVWNLTADAISVLCLHGTSTTKGDINEISVLETQLSHLGRSPHNNPALAVCSKWLTGHGKGAAGAWSINTALQILATGSVPRNGNLDDLDPEMERLQHISFLGGHGPAIKLASGVDCVSVSSFGFGQKGAQALLVHPRFLFAVLGNKEEFDAYWCRMKARRRVATREWYDGLWNGDLVGKRIKTEAARGGQSEEEVLLDRGWKMKG